MSARIRALPEGGVDRVARDRVELLEALIGGPGFDPLYRDDLITIQRDHPVYRWWCAVPRCERPRTHQMEYCHAHRDEWNRFTALYGAEASRASFLQEAAALSSHEGDEPETCRICPDRPAQRKRERLCARHRSKWNSYRARRGEGADLEVWVGEQISYAGYGICLVAVCARLAASPLMLCAQHAERYRDAGKPGAATLPHLWGRQDQLGRTVAVGFEDEAVFRSWCARTGPAYRFNQINLLGLRPLAKAELQWGLEAHARQRSHTRWFISSIALLADLCREHDVNCLADLLGLDACRNQIRQMVGEILTGLRPIYFTRAQSRELGFIETDHFGRRLGQSESHIDLSVVPQRWLRELLWDHLAALLESADCPRSRSPFDACRRACVELGTFLATDAPDDGEDPVLLDEHHVGRFVADQRHRARHGQPSLALRRSDGSASIVTDSTVQSVLIYCRKMLYDALESGRCEQIGLRRSFITCFPRAGRYRTTRVRYPFDDKVARALADEANLRQFAEDYDPKDRGLRDVWETLVYTGRRCSEVLQLRLDCIGHYGGAPLLWHDQTKVGNLDAGIRIPDYLYRRLDERRRKTLVRFEQRQGRDPAASERAAMALFPTHVRNPTEGTSISYGLFHTAFKAWVAGLDLGGCVPHQARHTLATKLLAAGATLTHIRTYLGHVSERMAEHYIKVGVSEIDDVLARVWVAGPGSTNPGEPLTSNAQPLDRQQAETMAVQVGRRCTPTLGGLCTLQVVVDGGRCPRNLDCDNCDKLVMTGADLLYWRRKREQWYSIAERAPDEATAAYLHAVFEPSARAIDGLEKVLAGLGLLDQALALDLRRPQDYFGHMWSTGFPVDALAAAGSQADAAGDRAA